MQGTYKVEVVVRGMEVPWGIAFTPEGRMLFTERPGRVRVMEKGRLRVKPLAELPDVVSRGEAGLMGIAVHPNHARNRWVYLAYVYNEGGFKVRVTRFKDTGEQLTERKVIIENIAGAAVHVGMALGFGPDGKLYITTGDAAKKELGDQLNKIEGKTLRLNDDGSIPRDNPFVNRSGARPEIWSYGHRNAQGIAWQPGSNLMFQTEHGPSGFDGPGGGDEVNIVERGKHYGWPAIHHKQTRDGMVSPLLEYTPSVAPGGAAFYRGDKIPAFKNNLFFACLRGSMLVRVVLDGRRVVRTEEMFKNEYGRLRAVAFGPDGHLYFGTSNRDGRGNPHAEDDRIFRLIPG